MKSETGSGAKLNWTIVQGDAFSYLKDKSLKANFMWFDIFSPRRTENSWTESNFSILKSNAAAGCELLTYSCANETQDNLKKAGWNVELIKAYQNMKDNWLKASA